MSPKAVDNCVESVLEDNPSYSESRAYAICHAQQNRGNLSVADGASHDELLQAQAAEGDDCPEGHVSIGDECVPVEDVGELSPPSIAHSARIMARGQMDVGPLERDELADGEVAYRNVKLLERGVWTDQNSQTPTLYDETTFKNLKAKSGEYDGPPVNIAHDVDADGNPNAASLGGYIDPDSLRAEESALFGDIIVDTTAPAGEFADANLQSALESQGEVGFSPSVEIDPAGEMELASDHPRAEHHATGGYLTGLGLVSNPASKPVDFATQTRERAVAMSAADGQEDKDVYLKRESMDTDAKILEAIATRELQMDEIEDDAQNIADELDVPIGDVMEVLDPLLDMEGDGDGDGEGDDTEEPPEDVEAEDDEDEDSEDEDDDNPMMAEEAIEAIQEEMDELWSEVDKLREDMVEEDMMQSTKEELAAADTVEEIETRLSELESEPEDNRTLGEGNTAGDDESEWFAAEGTISDSPNSL
jgi:hypothetical protein